MRRVKAGELFVRQKEERYIKKEMTKINSFKQLLEIANSVTSEDGLSLIFRGQADAAWQLLPKAGRPPYYIGKDGSRGSFKRWSDKASAYMPNLPENDWERLALAQHHGLATCLLDWTCNPLVAFYFSVESFHDRDGMFFAYHPKRYVKSQILHFHEEDIIGCYRPKPISPRIVNQQGVFTYHGKPFEPLKPEPIERRSTDPNLWYVVISSECKQECVERLHNFGINQQFLFPDLDGLSRHINWQTERINKMVE